MSHSTYNKLWADAQAELSDVLTEDLGGQSHPPETDKEVFFQHVKTLYVRYVRIFRQLEEAYDQVVHPQKRHLIRDVLEGVMGRVLELKREMVESDFSEYHYVDSVLLDLKLTPADVEIPVPKHFVGEQSAERGELLSSVFSSGVATESVEAPPLTLAQAIRLIQASERARQGRSRAKITRKMRQDENNQKRSKDKSQVEAISEHTALSIQKLWRGYLQRKKTKREREEEMIFLGMAQGRRQTQPCSSVDAVRDYEARRRRRRDENEADFQRAVAKVTERLREVEEFDMRDTMKAQIRQWIAECHDATGAFPDYPEQEEGGSALIFVEKTPQQVADEQAAMEEVEASKESKEQAAKKDDVAVEPGFTMSPSKFLTGLQEAQKTFEAIWQNRDESENPNQRHEAELIKEEKRNEIETEARLQVDELMRQELADLKLAVYNIEGGKAKEKKGGKKEKKGGKKEKKDKDLTPDRSLQSLCQELVEQGLMRQVEVVKLADYLGDFCYLGTHLEQLNMDPTPSLGDVRQVIALNAVLPLGSQVVTEKALLAKTLLLVGPTGVGKKMLVHAICQETGSNLFDLSPLNLGGKYPGKSGLQMMLHMVFKVAKLMQPSVIWIGGAEKMFYKKVPKEEKDLDPRRLKKDLPKFLKSVSDDRVLVVGTSRDPSVADIKSLCKAYAKVIHVPRPDYASRYLIWKRLIEKNGGEVTKALDLTSLAKISDGYTQGHILQAIRTVLTEQRMQELDKKPLAAVEFTPQLAKIQPVTQDEDEALKSWFAKTPLGKKRAEALTGQDEE
ncbi:dynein regulatory complex protein 11-like [Megalops cyprinoides]|uniref:dynein regulatory complex protein 11-like n=1 Tax=Megalops cyprinoides TaxID=118141 RepID=UPI001863CB3E|nr:dynein regulatory complex protein 11-like [Megalops cyprinoides]